jgi:hypothetical protein
MPVSISVTAVILAGVVATSAQGGSFENGLTQNQRGVGFSQSAVQLAASGNRLNGAQIRSLLSGRTARMERRRANKSLSIALSFGSGGSVRHVCTATHVNVGTHGAPQCRTPRASGNWAVRGSKLCIIMGKRRCYFVVRRGAGYAFRSPSGKGRPYAGKFSVQ